MCGLLGCRQCEKVEMEGGSKLKIDPSHVQWYTICSEINFELMNVSKFLYSVCLKPLMLLIDNLQFTEHVALFMPATFSLSHLANSGMVS